MIILLILVAAAAWLFFPKAFKALVAQHLSRETGLPVRIDQLDLNFRKPEFLLTGLQLLNPIGFPAADLARIADVKVQYASPLALVGLSDLKKVEVNFKELRLVRNESGGINLPLQLPMQAVGDTIEEVVINLGSVTYTDLSGTEPVQETYDLGLDKAVYRNVKGVAGIMEIVSWEVLKRTGVAPKEEAAVSPGPPAEEISTVSPSEKALPQN